MNAVLIHADGRAEILFGDFSGDLTTAAVLTQAATSALEASAGVSHAIQCQQDDAWVTLLRRDDNSWLRVTHEPGVTTDQVREWSSQLKPAKAATPAPSTGPLRVPSLADALNIGMP